MYAPTSARSRASGHARVYRVHSCDTFFAIIHDMQVLPRGMFCSAGP